MKNDKIFAILIVMLILFSFMNPVSSQTRSSMPQHQDTTKMKDPINRMPDSARLRQMMRDSNVMKDPHKMPQDSMPVKQGWMNSDSARKKSIRI